MVRERTMAYRCLPFGVKGLDLRSKGSEQTEHWGASVAPGTRDKCGEDNSHRYKESTVEALLTSPSTWRQVIKSVESGTLKVKAGRDRLSACFSSRDQTQHCFVRQWFYESTARIPTWPFLVF